MYTLRSSLDDNFLDIAQNQFQGRRSTTYPIKLEMSGIIDKTLCRIMIMKGKIKIWILVVVLVMVVAVAADEVRVEVEDQQGVVDERKEVN